MQRFFGEQEKALAELARKEQEMKKMKREAKEKLYNYEKMEQEIKLK